jgi:hypothetical protein
MLFVFLKKKDKITIFTRYKCLELQKKIWFVETDPVLAKG